MRARVCTAVLVLFAACSPEPPPEQPPPDQEVELGSYWQNECGTCVADACANEAQACASDADCADYLVCLVQCPEGNHGDVDGSCESECAPPLTSESETLRNELTECRASGPGAECVPCNVAPAPKSPILTQECEYRGEAPTPCRQCHWERCCDTWDACFGEQAEPECDQLATCVQSCSIPLEPCAASCMAQYPLGKGPLLEQVACGSLLCAIEQVDCDVSDRDACDQCLFGTCADHHAALYGDSDGYLLILCLDDCGFDSEECPACYERYPAALPLYEAWGGCVTTNCEPLC